MSRLEFSLMCLPVRAASYRGRGTFFRAVQTKVMGAAVTLAVDVFRVQRVRKEYGLCERLARRQPPHLLDVRAVDPIDHDCPRVFVAYGQLDLTSASAR